MEGKQLELFSDMDFEPKKLHIRKKNQWFLIDDFERKPTDYVRKENNSYKMAIGFLGKNISIHKRRFRMQCFAYGYGFKKSHSGRILNLSANVKK